MVLELSSGEASLALQQAAASSRAPRWGCAVASSWVWFLFLWAAVWTPTLAAPVCVLAELRCCDSAEDGRRNFLPSLWEAARSGRADAAFAAGLPAFAPAASRWASVAGRRSIVAPSPKASVAERAGYFRWCRRWAAGTAGSREQVRYFHGLRVARYFRFARVARRHGRQVQDHASGLPRYAREARRRELALPHLEPELPLLRRAELRGWRAEAAG